jgi:predicted aspartyl protease
MITDVVSAYHEGLIHVTVRGPRGRGQEIEAVIDTGFDGALSLPPSLSRASQPLASPGVG